jgi:hypothetical protein
MVSLLVSRMVEAWFSPWLGEMKDYKIRTATYVGGIWIMCLIGATCLPADHCFELVVLYIS